MFKNCINVEWLKNLNFFCNLTKNFQIIQKSLHRDYLEKVHPRGILEPRDVLKASPRAQPEGLPSEYPEAFRLSQGETFSTQGFSTICQT